ncbi:MAG: hypothetical protein ACJ8AW_14645 [Rhodopila sp.]
MTSWELNAGPLTILRLRGRLARRRVVATLAGEPAAAIEPAVRLGSELGTKPRLLARFAQDF